VVWRWRKAFLAKTDKELLASVVDAIRRTTRALHGEHPDDTLVGYALLTDDALSTLLYGAITKKALETSPDPDLLFCPNDWPYEPECSAFDDADAMLREWYQDYSGSNPANLKEHVDRSFGILVDALAQARVDGVLGNEVFASVLSTDPSKYLEKLATAGIQRLNPDELVRKHDEFMKKWQ
jgi:hypothetical protein